MFLVANCWQVFNISCIASLVGARSRISSQNPIAAYNVAKNTTSKSDVKILEIPHYLHVLVTKFMAKYS